MASIIALVSVFSSLVARAISDSVSPSATGPYSPADAVRVAAGAGAGFGGGGGGAGFGAGAGFVSATAFGGLTCGAGLAFGGGDSSFVEDAGAASCAGATVAVEPFNAGAMTGGSSR